MQANSKKKNLEIWNNTERAMKYLILFFLAIKNIQDGANLVLWHAMKFNAVRPG